MKLLGAIRKDKNYSLLEVADYLNKIENRNGKCNGWVIYNIEHNDNIEMDSVLRLCNCYWASVYIVNSDNGHYIGSLWSLAAIAQSLKFMRTIRFWLSRKQVETISEGNISRCSLSDIERKWNCRIDTLIRILKFYRMEMEIRYKNKKYKYEDYNIETFNY